MGFVEVGFFGGGDLGGDFEGFSEVAQAPGFFGEGNADLEGGFGGALDPLADDGFDVVGLDGFGEDDGAAASDELFEEVFAFLEFFFEPGSGDEGEAAAGAIVDVAQDFEADGFGGVAAREELMGFVHDEDAGTVEAVEDALMEFVAIGAGVGAEGERDFAEQGFGAAVEGCADENGFAVVIAEFPLLGGDGFAVAGFADDEGDGLIVEGVGEAVPDELGD